MQAILLAAGAGTRLRDVSPIKPLTSIGGQPLVAHVVDRLFAGGASEVIVVTGYEAAAVEDAVAALPQADRIRCIHNADWRQPNGVSVLAARQAMSGNALLAMADHLVEPRIYTMLAASGGAGLTLGIDRRIGHPWVDEEDVTRVQTEGDRIVAIGKGMARYDCYDCGVFRISDMLFDALAALEQPSLSDGVRVLAGAGEANVVDIGDAAWLDIDDARALGLAAQWLQKGLT